MSKKIETEVASDDGPVLTSAGVPWSEVPEFARPDVAWIDGRHGSAREVLKIRYANIWLAATRPIRHRAGAHYQAAGALSAAGA